MGCQWKLNTITLDLFLLKCLIFLHNSKNCNNTWENLFKVSNSLPYKIVIQKTKNVFSKFVFKKVKFVWNLAKSQRVTLLLDQKKNKKVDNFLSNWACWSVCFDLVDFRVTYQNKLIVTAIKFWHFL